MIENDVASIFQTHCFIIGTTDQRDDVRDSRQRDIFQNCYISVTAIYSASMAQYKFQYKSHIGFCLLE